jgi:hypothetical protein
MTELPIILERTLMAKPNSNLDYLKNEEIERNPKSNITRLKIIVNKRRRKSKIRTIRN